MLNIGILTPADVIDRVLEEYRHSRSKKAILPSVEGFIRQIIGWREFTRVIYLRQEPLGNFFDASGGMSQKWYEGRTKMPPVDQTIRKAFRTGYLHHIERLMVMANYMTLNGIRPAAMYKWFMEFAIDSYDWVMHFNIQMGAYSSGYITKPYISGGNYIAKMSNLRLEGPLDHWTELFWAFLKKHRAKVQKIPRLKMLLGRKN